MEILFDVVGVGPHSFEFEDEIVVAVREIFFLTEIVLILLKFSYLSEALGIGSHWAPGRRAEQEATMLFASPGGGSNACERRAAATTARVFSAENPAGASQERS